MVGVANPLVSKLIDIEPLDSLILPIYDSLKNPLPFVPNAGVSTSFFFCYADV